MTVDLIAFMYKGQIFLNKKRLEGIEKIKTEMTVNNGKLSFEDDKFILQITMIIIEHNFEKRILKRWKYIIKPTRCVIYSLSEDLFLEIEADEEDIKKKLVETVDLHGN